MTWVRRCTAAICVWAALTGLATAQSAATVTASQTAFATATTPTTVPDGWDVFEVTVALSNQGAGGVAFPAIADSVTVLEEGLFPYQPDAVLWNGDTPEEGVTLAPGQDALLTVVVQLPTTRGALTLNVGVGTGVLTVPIGTNAPLASDPVAQDTAPVLLNQPERAITGAEINVALPRHLASARTAAGPVAGLMDGETEPFSRRVALAPGEAAEVHFARPYPLSRVELVLNEGALPDLRIEGLDGSGTWVALSADLVAPKDRELAVVTDPVPVSAIRISGLASGQSGVIEFLLYELRALTTAVVPTDMADLGDWHLGTRPIFATSGEWLREPPFAGSAIWASARAAGADAPLAPQEVTFALHGDRPTAIEAVSLRVWAGPQLPPPARVEIFGAASIETPAEAFALIGTFDVAETPRVQLFEFAPTDVGALRLRLIPREAAPQMAVWQMGIHEAPVVGRAGFEAAYVRRPDPALDVTAGTDLASLYTGARILEVEDGSLARETQSDLRGLNNDDYSFASEVVLPSRLTDGRAPTMTFAFTGDQIARVEAVQLHTRYSIFAPSGPWQVRLSYATESVDGPWTPIGDTVLLSYENGWRELRFDPVDARYLRIELSESYGDAHILWKIRVLEGGGPDYIPIADRSQAEWPPMGINLAHAALGGQITVAYTLPGVEGWGVAALQDGLSTDRNGFLETNSYGYSSDIDPVFPVDFDIRFQDGRAAEIMGVLLDPATRTQTRGGIDPSFSGSPEDRPRQVELWVEAEGRWERASGIETLSTAPEPRFIPFDAPRTVEAVRLRVLSNFGGERLQLGEIEVLAPPVADQAVPAVAPVDIVISDVGHGGGILRYSSAADGFSVGDLVDRRLESPLWQAADLNVPQAFTVHFSDFQSADIARIEVDAPQGVEAAFLPRQLRLSASDATEPSSGWQDLGTFGLSPGQTTFVYTPPAPVPARFVRVEIIAAGEQPVALSAIRVIEARTPGVASVLERSTAAETTTLAEAEFALDAEPNDTTERAAPLVIGGTVDGVIAPLSDVDTYRLDIGPDDPAIIEFSLQGEPTFQNSFALLDDQSAPLASLTPTGAAALSTSVSLEAGTYFATLSTSPSSIVLLIDNSGSISPVLPTVRAAAGQFAAGLRPDETMSVMTFGDQPEVLVDFTNDAELAAQAIGEGLTGDRRGTDLYDAVIAALAALEDRGGNRAVVLLTDGGDVSSQSAQEDAWRALETAGVPLYIIGLGPTMPIYWPEIGNSAENLLRGWAAASGGRFYPAPDADDLPETYAEIASDLRRPVPYSMRVSGVTSDGFLALAAGESLTNEVASPPNVLMVLDASGSMRGETLDGRPRIDAAREVMARILDLLPETTQVGLRVYGHRLPRDPKAQSCTDTELVVPFQPINPAAMMDVIQTLRPQGQTPIGLSLAQISEDFAGVTGERRVLLVTDGIETCDESEAAPYWPPNVVAGLRAAGVDLHVDIVGFDVEDSETRSFLRRIAEQTGGRFYPASGAAALEGAIRESLRAPFRVVDSNGRIWAEGQIGDPPVNLPAARFTIEIEAAELIRIEEVTIAPDFLTIATIQSLGEEVIATTEVTDPADFEAPFNQDRDTPTGPDLVRAIQAGLNARGFDAGPVDGLMGARTRDAIRAFEAQMGLAETGAPTPQIYLLLTVP